ncbi:hypothetical protein PTKIN_Ptkin11bG0201000 [Pterospermum kingtungense]
MSSEEGRLFEEQLEKKRQVKFNVDGSSRGKLGPAGIGGILIDHMRQVLIRFSKAIGIEDSNAAEYLAIRKALLIFISSPWVHIRKFCVESDSMNVVNWVFDPSKVLGG